MKYKIVIVPFPFDDLSGQKARPAVCLTDEILPYGHLVLAFITSKLSANPSATDFVISSQDADFALTGLKVSSTVRLHRLMTVSSKIITRELGELSKNQWTEMKTACENYLEFEML
ncbi:MAG: type II toxin-antitoxin system PemK/MazF family toxin [Acidobacteria bacterium]|jgi:mRNA interferase MazF|nr:type II toxin-antitoxin system PemK/MazF family toxin [Acidobacteriota bacterium]MBA4122714.1 type II toxin-antitoxin system PemK/MazF family toxin [Acidobacteriota bacterium]MBA4183847.1 type II toxin-antitoxin system PemK/MazF family toxin [Acidobacteriota bacterium]